MLLRCNLTFLDQPNAPHSFTLEEQAADRPWIPSQVWVCTGCARSYAILSATDYAGRKRTYQAMAGRCLDCPPHFGFIPGSIWNSWDRGLSDALPQGLMNREVLLHIAHLERMENERP